MDKIALQERLLALASDSKNRSIAASLRDVIDDIEFAMAAGVSRAAIVDELNTLGFEISLITFQSTIQRIRKKRLNQSNPKNHAAASRSKPVLSVHAAETETGDNHVVVCSHSPVDLDNIINSYPDLEALSRMAKKRPPR